MASSTVPTGATDDGAPPITEVTTRAELGLHLTALRRRSSFSLRELAAAIGSSPSTLSGWCRAENLPFPAQHELFRDMLRTLGVADPEPWMAALVRVRDGAGAREPAGDPPYQGLESFGRDDAERFFGREELVRQAHDRWRAIVADPARPNLLVLVGASGSGKSSVLHAGLRPRLERDGARCWTMAPGPSPVTRLRTRLAELEGAAVAETDGARQVLLVDQFEELFTACQDAAERVRFLRAIEELAAPARGPAVGVVVTLRIDFYGELVATRQQLAPVLQDAQVLVGPMDRTELTRAIVGPAERAGVGVDHDLVALVLRDFLPTGALAGAHDAGALPLLSHALLETWRRARRGQLTVADYHAAGGIDGAIERSAEQVYAALTPDEQAVVRQLFLRLVHLEGDTIATRRVATYEELDGLEAGATSLAAVLDRFVDARLLTAHRTSVEITHEALLAAWPRLRAWIDEDRETLRLHRRIVEAAHAWAESGRDPASLVRGTRLEAMRPWLDGGSHRLVLSRLERDLLDASVVQADAEQVTARRRTRRLRALAVAASVFAVLAGVSALAAVQARSEALQARDEALSRQVALSSARLAEVDPGLAAQLAVVGYDIAPTSEARGALLDAAASPRSGRILGGAGSTAVAATADGRLVAVSDAVASHVQLLVPDGEAGLARAATLPLADPEAESFALAFSPDGTRLAVGDTTAAITLWDVADPDRPERLGEPLRGPEGPTQALAFHPAGTELAAVGLGDGVFRWEVTDPSAPRPLPLLPSEHITWSVAYHPGGDHLVVGEDAGAAVLWELGADPRPVVDLPLSDRSTLAVAFSPDGAAVAAGSRTGELGVWELGDLAAAAGEGWTPTRVEVTDATFDSWLNSLAFSPDGDLLVGGSSDGALQLYATSTWSPVRQLPHPAAITTVTFTDDGATLLSSATDGTTRSWDLAASLPVTLGGSIWSVGFTEGRHLAAFSAVDTGVWDATDPWALRPLLDPIPEPPDEALAFTGGGAVSPDGRWLAHGTRGGEVLLHDRTGPDPTEGTPLGTSPGLVEMTAFSADGVLVAAGGGDTAVRVWALDGAGSATPVATFDDPTENVLNLAFSPVGRLLAAASADDHVYLYDLSDPADARLVARLGGFDSEVYAVAFDPDASVLAAAGTDAVVQRWDLTDPTDPQPIGAPLAGPTGRVFDLAFHPRGDRLAAAVADGTAWVWDTTDREAPVRHAALGPSPGPVYTVRFAPAGDLLVAGGAHGELHRWPVAEEDAIARICAGTGDPLTEAEWELYLPDRAYAPPCG
jgi:WD40 repeat protein/transcriptional regulator with XRE-family HTH domain